MSGLFSKPKRAKPPPMPSPVPMRQPADEETMKRALDKRRRMLAAVGRAGTILTQTLGEPERKTLLGD